MKKGEVGTSGDCFLRFAHHNSPPLQPDGAPGRPQQGNFRPGWSNSQPARNRQASDAHAHHAGRARARRRRCSGGQKWGRAPDHPGVQQHRHASRNLGVEDEFSFCTRRLSTPARGSGKSAASGLCDRSLLGCKQSDKAGEGLACGALWRKGEFFFCGYGGEALGRRCGGLDGGDGV